MTPRTQRVRCQACGHEETLTETPGSPPMDVWPHLLHCEKCENRAYEPVPDHGIKSVQKQGWGSMEQWFGFCECGESTMGRLTKKAATAALERHIKKFAGVAS